MPPYWGYEPTLWDRIVAIGIDVWILAALAAGIGIIAARTILIPRRHYAGDSRAQLLARIRTSVGFVFVAALSMPFRNFDDTVDNALGNFNISVAVALGVFLAFALACWVSVRGDSRARLRFELPKIFGRVAKFAAALVGTWLALALTDFEAPSASADQAKLALIIVFGLIGLYSMGCWCISCYWFGIGHAHPLLPPFVAAATVLIMAGRELASGSPDPLPLPLWLLINVAAVITTLGVCFVEICDVTTEARGSRDGLPLAEPARWPVYAAASFVTLALIGATIVISPL